MKKLLLAIIILLISTVCFGQMYYGDKYQRVEYRCEVCGKYIYAWEKISQSNWEGIDPGFSQGWPGSYWSRQTVPDSLSDDNFTLSYLIDHICKECLFEYSDRIKAEMDATWDAYWDKKKHENRKKSEIYTDQKKLDQVRDIENKVKELEQEKLWLLHPELKPKEVILKGWGTFLCDSIQVRDTLKCLRLGK